MSNIDNINNGSTNQVWHNAKAWIESNGGFVHPLLSYDENARQVFLGSPSNTNAAAAELTPSADDNNIIMSASRNAKKGLENNGINAQTTLLQIPDNCLLSLHSAENTTFGKLLFRAVHSIASSSSSSNRTSDASEVVSSKEDYSAENDGLYNDSQDVILGLFLAHLLEQQQANNQHQHSPKKNEKQLVMEQKHYTTFYQPYLATLPQLSSLSSDVNSTDIAIDISPEEEGSNKIETTNHALLPRQWSPSTLRKRLCGTSLYNRIVEEQAGLLREYELVKCEWRKLLQDGSSSSDVNGNISNGTSNSESEHTNENNHHCDNIGSAKYNNKIDGNYEFPSCQNYSDMMAVLSSRGFSGLGHDGVDVLIPLLDLLNHVRGGADGLNESRYDDANRGDISNGKNTEGIGEDNLGNGSGDDADENGTHRRGADIRYERYEQGDASEEEHANKVKNEETVAKRRKLNGGKTSILKGGVRVTAAKWLLYGKTLQMTYGAKGNAALLGRYGFCIPNNVEPDGESTFGACRHDCFYCGSFTYFFHFLLTLLVLMLTKIPYGTTPGIMPGKDRAMIFLTSRSNPTRRQSNCKEVPNLTVMVHLSKPWGYFLTILKRAAV